MNMSDLPVADRPRQRAESVSRAASPPVQPQAVARPKVRRLTPFELFLKRSFDIVGVLLIAALFALPMIIIALSIRLTCPGKVVFGHKRVGRRGSTFQCYKFRSMVPNAQDVLRELLARDPAAREEWATTFKLKDDPRITRIGRFIRKTSLDELPQLWNVLRGDMSLVGPRPVVRQELEQYYGAGRRHYISVRPGLTGLWQVSGRNDISYDQRVALDIRYVEEWSLWRDLVIVLRTAKAVLGSHDAY